MSRTYILRKGVSTLGDLRDGAFAGGPGSFKGVAGTVFYVDAGHSNASDSNTGDDPNAPLLTIATAYARCTADVGDVIYVTGERRYREAELQILKDGIRIVGGGWGTEWNQNASPTGYVVRVNAKNVIFSNIQISVNDQGGGIYVGDVGTGGVNYNAFGLLVENCFIRGDWYTAGGSGASVTYGVYNHGAPIMTLQNNLIWGWARGVQIEGGDSRTSYGARVINNDILYCKTYGIRVEGAGYPSLIKGNTIADMDTSTALTYGIYLANSTGNTCVAGNFLGCANPVYDSGNLNIWVGNFIEEAATASEVKAVEMEAF